MKPLHQLDHELLAGTRRAIDQRVAVAQVEGRVPSLAAAVVRDATVVWSGIAGKLLHPDAEQADSRADDDGSTDGSNVQFRIGSITKTFVAVLIMRLRDAGALDLSDTLDDHVERTHAGAATLAQLLSHTAGIASEPVGPWWERTPGALRPSIANLLDDAALKHSPGRRYHYSNPAFAYLGAVVERHRKQPWHEALCEEVLVPLGLTRTSYAPTAPHALGFAVHPWADIAQAEPLEDTGAMAPAGQLWSTTGDLCRFASFLAVGNERVLSTSTLGEMRTPTAPADLSDRDGAYGLGMRIQRRGERLFAGHSGSMPGFLAGLLVDPATGVGAAALCNTTAGAAPTELAADLIEIVLDREPQAPAPWRPLATIDADVLALAGPWYWGPAPFTMHVGGNRCLSLRPLGSTAAPARFAPCRDGTWTGLDGYHAGETMRAAYDADGAVTHLDIGTFVYTREPYDPDTPVPGGVAGWPSVER